MKYLFGVSKETLINMLNSLFNQNFSIDDATIIQTNSEFVDEAFDIIRGDLFYVVLDESKPYHLHIELQTRPDGHMAILVDIKDDGSEEVIRRIVPVVKYWELTEKDLIERQLYPLLPLQIFLLRGELKKYAKEKDSENKRQLIQQIKELTEKIIVEAKNLAEAGKISEGDDDRIVTALGKLIKYLNEQYNFDEKLDKEVGTVIESVFTTLERNGTFIILLKSSILQFCRLFVAYS